MAGEAPVFAPSSVSSTFASAAFASPTSSSLSPSGQRLRILVAPDSFKGSATAAQAAGALARGLARALPDSEVLTLPMADGGEGTVQALVDATGGVIVRKSVTGPLGEPVEAFFGILGDGTTAAIEMAAASGLPLVPPHRRNPRVTTTYGTGELIRAALDRGCRRLIIGIGGSATNDGGAGMAQALGVRLLDREGRELGPGGAELARLDRIDRSGLDPRIAGVEVRVACDVDNPLCGPQGASAVYGPQKGATPEMVRELDAALAHFAWVVARDLGVEIRDLAGAGAAGGLGGGLVAFLGGRLQRGVELVIETVGLERRMAGVHLVVTGEGGIDRQTRYGKTPAGVGRIARKLGIPAVAVVGTIGDGVDRELLDDCGLCAVMSILPGPLSLEEAMRRGEELLEATGERLGWLLGVGGQLGR